MTMIRGHFLLWGRVGTGIILELKDESILCPLIPSLIIPAYHAWPGKL